MKYDPKNFLQHEPIDERARCASLHGEWITPLRYTSEQVCIEHIARTLSNMCRNGGRITRFYSYAQHAVLMSRLVEMMDGDVDLQRVALLHKASYAIVGDDFLDSGFRHGQHCTQATHDPVQRVILDRLDLSPSLMHHETIVDTNARMVFWEVRDLAPELDFEIDWQGPFEINPLGPERAYDSFVLRFVELFPEHAEAMSF